jgi:hypothetical protein
VRLRLPSPGDQGREPVGVQAAARLQGIPAGSGTDEARVAERAAGPVHQHAQVAGRVGRRRGRPERLGQRAVRHVPVPVDGQHGQQRADLAATERRDRHLAATDHHPEPSEQPDLHVLRGHAASVAATRRPVARKPQTRLPNVGRTLRGREEP